MPHGISLLHDFLQKVGKTTEFVHIG